VAVVRHEHSATINQLVAAILASYVETLLDGTCAWMATWTWRTDRCIACQPTLVRLPRS
jgi:hypothetical protein